MLIHPDIDPVALRLGPIAVHWYGLTYLAAFGLFLFLGRLRLRHRPFAGLGAHKVWSPSDVEDILFLGVMGWWLADGSVTVFFTSRPITCPIRWRCWRSGRAA